MRFDLHVEPIHNISSLRILAYEAGESDKSPHAPRAHTPIQGTWHERKNWRYARRDESYQLLNLTIENEIREKYIQTSLVDFRPRRSEDFVGLSEHQAHSIHPQPHCTRLYRLVLQCTQSGRLPRSGEDHGRSPLYYKHPQHMERHICDLLS
jgi:hypothetical protein